MDFCGDGWGWNRSSVGMEVKLDGDAYKFCMNGWGLGMGVIAVSCELIESPHSTYTLPSRHERTHLCCVCCSVQRLSQCR